MNKNVKIAKDLIRIAKSLISNEQINKQNTKRNYISIQELKAPWESLEASI